MSSTKEVKFEVTIKTPDKGWDSELSDEQIADSMKGVIEDGFLGEEVGIHVKLINIEWK